MSAFPFWSLFYLALPVAGPQALWTRRRALSMPAQLENGASGSSGHGEIETQLLVAGESPAVGVGCSAPEESLPVQVARALAERRRVATRWQVIGANGATAADVADLLKTAHPVAPDPQVLGLVFLGANDVTRLTRIRDWERELHNVARGLQRRGAATVYLAPVPPMWQFTLLPQPLRAVLGQRARLLDAARVRMAAEIPWLQALTTEFEHRPDLLAADGYHPGPAACALWADRLVEQITTLGDQP